jgi:Domain of unknown function (DUF4836)
MQIRFKTLLIIALAVFFTACSKTNKEGKFIPADAAIAVHINGASLSAKLPWEEVKNTELFKQLSSDTGLTSIAKQALENPDNSGIETKSDLFFFMKKDSLGGYAAFSGTVKDAEKFKLFNLDLAKNGVESEQDGVKYLSKYPVCVGWNKEKFVYISHMSGFKKNNYIHNDDSGAVYSESRRDILKTCKEVFDVKEDNSLGKNEKFTELVKKTGDVHFWMNSEELQKGGLNEAGLKMMNIDLEKLYKGSITTATINFENGKIVADSKSYASKEVAELWKKYGGKVDESILKRLPAKDVALVVAMNFKPEGIKEMVKLIGVEGYANIGLAAMGFTLDDFVKANKGDLLIAVSDFKNTADSAAQGGMSEINMFSFPAKPDFLFATSVGDKDAFNKLVKAGERLGKNLPAQGIPQISYNTNGSYFAIGNSKENIDKFIAGANSNFDFINKITGQSMGGYVNIQYILKAFANEAGKDSSGKAVYDASVAFWDNANMKGGDYDDGGMTSHYEINLMDKNTNSLKQLNQYLGKLGAIAKKQKEKRDKEMEVESRTLYPPPPADASKK